MFEIRPAQPSDTEQIVALLNEMDEFYGDRDRETLRERVTQVEQTLFPPGCPTVEAVVAADRDTVIGLASFSMLWPAALTSRSLYLKELYVLGPWRGKGVGRLLMQEIERIAHERQCSRIEFTTDRGNLDAQAFYTSLGFQPHGDKIFYRRNL